jgi:MurNAc alpha-1-phosphate uridylyltransferase
MKINTALILCAGYGKRLNPITLKTPKSLIKINNISLLENTINLIKELGISEIKLNTFYLKDQIKIFIEQKNFDVKIEIIEDGNEILDTGGGILNMTNSINEEDFFIFNPDTVWSAKNVNCIKEMESYYFSKKIQNILMVVNKDLSFDKKLKGDFNLEKNLLSKGNQYIYTGCQILNRNLLKNINKKVFSINEIWNELVSKNNLFGFESRQQLIHLTDFKIYNRLLKSN